MSKSSLSSVVSNLVRASMGSSVSGTVTDEDLDRHVAELILKEAKQKAERYGKDGIRAYLPQSALDSNAPKTNKRFLTSIIRSTDDHNKTILRAQALAAQEVRMEREEQERRERRARAEEASAAARMRRLMGSGGTEWAHNWDRGERRDRKRRERSWERRSDDEDDWRHEGDREHRSDKRERHHRRRSKSVERHRRKDDGQRHRRSSCEHSSDRRDGDDDEERERRRHRRERDRSRHTTPTRSGERVSEDGDPSNKGRTKRRRHSSRDLPRRRHRSPGPSDEQSSRSHSVDSNHASRSHRRQRPLSPSNDTDDRQEDGSSSRFRRKEEERSPSETLFREEELRRQLKRKGKQRASAELLASRKSESRKYSPHGLEEDDFVPSPDRTHGSSSSRTLRSGSPSRSRPPSPSASPPPVPVAPPSKMDKYFESSYDPRFDVAPLSAPTVPKTGLVNDAEFAGWDAMLELIRVRREDKEEKKRLERWGIGKDVDKGKKDKRRKEDDVEVGIMDIAYKKRGSVREWDMGKEGF